MTPNTPVRQHDIGSVVMASDVYTGMIVERDQLKAINAELLAALEAVMNGQLCGAPDMDAKRFQMARAAIAKAKGE